MNRLNLHARNSLAAVALVTASLMTPAMAQNIAVVNNKPIAKSQADAIIAQLVSQGQKDSPELQQAIRDELVTREVLMQEADRRGLPANAQVKEEIERRRQQVLINALAQDFFRRNPPTDAELRKHYDQLVKQMTGKEYRVRHILVDKEAEARGLILRLKGGAKFEDLAKQSKDSGSAQRGGDLDWAAASNYVPPFAEAITKLGKGNTTQTPVRTQFGFHVIRVDDVRDTKPPAFQESREQIANALLQNQEWQQSKFQAMITELRSRAKIE